MGRPAILITGAAGEVGHSLIEHFSSEDEYQVIAFDLKKQIPLSGVARDFAWIEGDVTKKDQIISLFSKYDIRQVFHLAAILSSGGERNPERTHEVNVQGSFNLLATAKEYSQKIGTPIRFMFPSTIAVYGIPSKEEKERAGRITESQFQSPITMYGVNKLHIEHLGRYFGHFYKYLDENPNDIKIDFRAVRFPGLMSSETVPSGGTSDYGSEMIHSCAQNKPYECFVSPDAKLPFMAMPDAIDALVNLSKAPREQLTQDVYNVGSFAVTAEEICQELKKHYQSVSVTYKPHLKRESIVHTWPADVDDAKARKDWGWKPRFDKASTFGEYLIPNINRRYQ